MVREFTRLDEFLADNGVDGYLLWADGEDPDQRYLTDVFAADPFLTLYSAGETTVLLSSMEAAQARAESRADTVANLMAYGLMEKLEEHGTYEGYMRVVVEFLADHGIESVSVPSDFPASAADYLRDEEIDIEPEPVPLGGGVVSDMRATKSEVEIASLERVQGANEAAMGTVETLLQDATVEDGLLHHEGEVLTVDRVKTELEMELLRQGCVLKESIVSCGADAAEPHNLGSGPLRANETIVVDIFPQDKETDYFGDMSRTFLKGTPDDDAREFYERTLAAMEAAFDVIEAGVPGQEVFDAACDVFEAAGHPTIRSDESTTTGFITGLGHGVGLEIHEQPNLAATGDELEAGHVVTVEPGLYDPEVGGVRIEDMVVVTEDGFENLNDYPKHLVVE